MVEQHILSQFVLEATEHLEAFEQSLLAMERTQDVPALIRSAFHHIHAIKGASGYTDLIAINRLSHELENVLKALRDRRIAATRDNVNTLLQGVDLLRACIAHIDEPTHGSEEIEHYIATLDVAPSPPPEGDAIDAIDAHTNVAESAQDDAVHRALRSAGEQQIAAMRLAIGRLQQGEAQGDSRRNLERTAKLLRRSADYVGAHDIVGCLDEILNTLATHAVLGEEHVATLTATLDTLTARLDKLGQVAQPAVPTEQTQASAPNGLPATPSESVLRVSLSKVDTIVNLVSDLVVARNSLAHAVVGAERDGWTPEHSEAVQVATHRLDKLTTALQTQTMAIRMVPVRSLFDPFRRVVRDISQAEGKDVTLVVLGGETEIDKGVCDQLRDPLLHLVRNAIAHGLEPTEERCKAGKSAQGAVTLKAEHEGSYVSIEIIDDGRGMEPERIREAARRLAFTTDAELDELNERELVDLVFRPGFTTAKAADGLAGRGVGLDAALTNVKRLGGNIHVDWEAGAGSRFCLRLPLSLLMVEAMIVAAQGQRFAIPTTFVVRNLRVDRNQMQRVGDSWAIIDQGEAVGLRALNDLLDNGAQSGNEAPQDTLILLQHGSRRLALAVDAIVAQHDILVRPLPPELRRLERFSGATLMGDGTLVLVLDPTWLFAARSSTPRRAQKPKEESNEAVLGG